MEKEFKNMESLNEELVDITNSEDLLDEINEELEVFESGIDEDDFELDMTDEDINEQTMKFLEIHGKRSK